MSVRILLSAGFIFHTILGTFCMVPMTYAMESPMAHEDHEEIAMTPMTPVSSVHCAGCRATELRADHAAPMAPSCAGHCLSQAKDAAMGALSFAAPQVHLPMVMMQTFVWKKQYAFTQSFAERSPDPIATQTIVLRV